MKIGMSVIACSFFYILLLAIVYFNKERLKTYENKLYSILLFSNIIGLFLEFACCLTVKNMNLIPFINKVTNRIYLIYFVTYIIIFTNYVYYVSFNNGKRQKFIINSKIVFSLIYIVSALFVLLLPLYYFCGTDSVYSYGPATNYLTILCLVCMIIDLYCLVKNIDNIKQRKYIPLFALLICFIIAFVIRVSYPEIILINSSFAFVTAIMYFTIENPDLQMLREMHNAKEYNDNLNMEKSRFLFNMAKEIKIPLQNINRLSKESLMEDDITLVKEGLNKIKYSSNNLLDLVNKVLDINELEKRKISTRESKYNIELLFKKIISVVKPKIENKGIEFRINYDKSIPTNLYGDSIRIKQVVTTILNHSVDLTKEGFIELSVNSIIKHDNCRIVIKIEDSSSGIKQDEIEKVFEVNIEKDIENIDDKDISIGLVKKILDLIGGTIIVNSELGKGTSYTIVVDQQIPDSKKTSITEAVEKYEEMYIKNKRILLVIKDEDLNKKLTKYLSKYEVEIVSATGGQACLERIRKNEKYDLIIMEDELDKLSSIDTLNKLKQIENFKIPVIILTRKIELNIKKEYLKIGFTDTYIIPVSKESVKEIITNYVLKGD